MDININAINNLLKMNSNIPLNWDAISKIKNLPMDFICEHTVDLNWEIICQVQNLTEDTMEYCLNYLSWDNVSASQNLSEEFMRKHFDNLNTELISTYQELSEEFILDYCDRLDWYGVSEMELSERVLEECEKYIRWDVYFLSHNITPVFFHKHKNKTGLDDEELDMFGFDRSEYKY